jgi:hypothetical protein
LAKKILIAGDDGSVYKIGAKKLARCKVSDEEAARLHGKIKSGGDDKSKIHPLVCAAFAKSDRVFVDMSRVLGDDEAD